MTRANAATSQDGFSPIVGINRHTGWSLAPCVLRSGAEPRRVTWGDLPPVREEHHPVLEFTRRDVLRVGMAAAAAAGLAAVAVDLTRLGKAATCAGVLPAS